MRHIYMPRYEQQKSDNFCWSLTNPQLVGKGRKISNPKLEKVGKHRERMESPDVQYWSKVNHIVHSVNQEWHWGEIQIVEAD
jgi:hypothetical protein